MGAAMAEKVVLVTGAQQGIGAACALAFAAAGYDVAVNWLDNLADAEGVAAGVRAAGRRAALIQGDVGSVPGCQAIVQGTVEALGRIDVLVNNAGMFSALRFPGDDRGRMGPGALGQPQGQRASPHRPRHGRWWRWAAGA